MSRARTEESPNSSSSTLPAGGVGASRGKASTPQPTPQPRVVPLHATTSASGSTNFLSGTGREGSSVQSSKRRREGGIGGSGRGGLLPPVSNHLFKEFPELAKVHPRSTAKVRSHQAQPYLQRQYPPRVRNPFLKTPTPADTQLEPNATLLNTWSHVMGGTFNSTSASSPYSQKSLHLASLRNKKKKKKSGPGGGGGGGHNKLSSTADGSGGRSKGNIDQVTGSYNSTMRVVDEQLLALAKQRGVSPPRPTTKSVVPDAIPPSDISYQLPHQQSCPMCNQEAVKAFTKREGRVRKAEEGKRTSLEGLELEGRRELYRGYAPQHNFFRGQVEQQISEAQRVLTLTHLQQYSDEVQTFETQVREKLEMNQLRMLRALRRCCFRTGWELQSELDEMASQEFEKVKQLEEAEALLVEQERLRWEKITMTKAKYLQELEARHRHEVESVEFRDFIKSLLRHKEGTEKASGEMQRRLDQVRATERSGLEVTMMRRRGKSDEEEKDQRVAIRARYMRHLAQLRQRPIQQKLMELPGKEEVARAQKLQVLSEEYMYISLALQEEAETLSRHYVREQSEVALCQVLATGQTLGIIETHECIARRHNLDLAEDSEYENFMVNELVPTWAADELVCRVMYKYE